jgi:hypothetical protein
MHGRDRRQWTTVAAYVFVVVGAVGRIDANNELRMYVTRVGQGSADVQGRRGIRSMRGLSIASTTTSKTVQQVVDERSELSLVAPGGRRCQPMGRSRTSVAPDRRAVGSVRVSCCVARTRRTLPTASPPTHGTRRRVVSASGTAESTRMFSHAQGWQVSRSKKD